mmetsp:Transcript_135852/g.378595  ORF Transcript_135852/g.378595 Transcript_135852/m.378595 type:complete len:272 (+) Transcript_135852:238-1053(+)
MPMDCGARTLRAPVPQVQPATYGRADGDGAQPSAIHLRLARPRSSASTHRLRQITDALDLRTRALILILAPTTTASSTTAGRAAPEQAREPPAPALLHLAPVRDGRWALVCLSLPRSGIFLEILELLTLLLPELLEAIHCFLVLLLLLGAALKVKRAANGLLLDICSACISRGCPKAANIGVLGLLHQPDCFQLVGLLITPLLHIVTACEAVRVLRSFGTGPRCCLCCSKLRGGNHSWDCRCVCFLLLASQNALEQLNNLLHLLQAGITGA